MWSTLAGREDGLVDSLLEIGLLVLSEEDETSSRTSEGLVAVRGNGGSDPRDSSYTETNSTPHVVVVTTSQYSNGWFCSPAATKPEI